MLATDDLGALRDRFDDRLQFGTAGLRGPLGAGPNRMNRALVRRATAGVAAWLQADGRLGPVVVGRDARHGSEAFAREVAEVLAGAGRGVLVLPGPLPTPLLAFATRHVGAAAGIMITASHNPPQDNGYKLYLGDGAQIVPPDDSAISAAIDAVGPLSEVRLAVDGIEVLGDEVLAAYLDGAVRLLDPAGGPRQITAVYTAMHGVGASTLPRSAGCGRLPAARTRWPRRWSPTPTSRRSPSPTPRSPAPSTWRWPGPRRSTPIWCWPTIPTPTAWPWRSRTRARRADGARSPATSSVPCSPTTCCARGGLGPDDVLATTVVSSRLLAHAGRRPPVWPTSSRSPGFKWVVRTPGPGQRLAFGYEEALGYCVGDLVRDKDGITAALVAAELAADARAGGASLLERLHDIFEVHGAHVTRQRSVRLEGSDWLDRVTEAMAAVRADTAGPAGRPGGDRGGGPGRPGGRFPSVGRAGVDRGREPVWWFAPAAPSRSSRPTRRRSCPSPAWVSMRRGQTASRTVDEVLEAVHAHLSAHGL